MIKHVLLVPLAVMLAVPAVSASAAEMKPVQLPPAHVSAAERAVAGESLDPVENEVRWQVGSAGQNAAGRVEGLVDTAGREGRCLEVSYAWQQPEERIEYLELKPTREVTIREPGRALVFYLKADASLEGSPVRYRITDSTGETLQGNFARVRGTDWTRVAARLDEPSSSWGGDDDGDVDYPASLTSLLFDRPDDPDAEGTLLVDDIRWATIPERDGTPMEVEASNLRFGNIYRPGEQIRLRVSAADSAPEGMRVQMRLVDFRGRVLKTRDARPGGAGSTWNLTPERRGWYRARLTALEDDHVVSRRNFQFAVEKPYEGRTKKIQSPFILQGHFRGGYPLPVMDLVASRGASMFRDEMSWSSVEREKGEFSFPRRYERYAEKARELNLGILLILDYNNTLYGEGFPTDGQARRAFARYARTMARKFRGQIMHYEVWNEWTVGCGMGDLEGDPAKYTGLLRPTYRALKEVEEDITVIGIGGEHSGNRIDHIKTMFRDGALDHCDAVSVHSYRYPQSPEESDLYGELENVADLMEQYGGDQDIWVTEIGWPTHEGARGVDEFTQAQYLVRSHALMLATKGVTRISWYDFYNDGTEPTYNEHNFGLIHNEAYNCAPKPGSVAYREMTGQLTGTEFQELEKPADGLYLATFSGDGREIVVAWSTSGPRELTVEGVDSAHNMVGNPIHVSSGVTVDAYPLYLAGDEPLVRPQN